jgi:protein-arginine kinase activator protein McsA
MTHTADGDFCESCLGYLFMRCSNCDTWVRNSDVCRVSDGSGGTVGVCRDCFDTDYAMCGHCGEVFLAEDLLSAHDVNGNDTVICDGCRDRYFESCDECDSIFDSSVMVDGRCPNCYAKEESEGIA